MKIYTVKIDGEKGYENIQRAIAKHIKNGGTMDDVKIIREERIDIRNPEHYIDTSPYYAVKEGTRAIIAGKNVQ